MSPSYLAFIFASLLLAQAQDDRSTCQNSDTDAASCVDGHSLLQTRSNNGMDVESEANHDLFSEVRDLYLLESNNGVDVESDSGVVEQLRTESMTLAQTLNTLAEPMPEGSATKGLLESFRICGQCGSFQRFGEANDGGYLMCMDGLKKGSVSSAYSLGVEHHDQWSEDVIKHLGIPVHQFDCTVDTSDCKSCKFYKKCIVAADGQHPVPFHEAEGWSLEQALTETSHGTPLASIPDGSLLMKMDIESSEWPIYASEPPAVLQKFGELIVEFHGLQFEERHAEYLTAMQHIQAAGFKVAHIHGNNYEGTYSMGTETIPRVIEVTFVHSDARADGCEVDQLYDVTKDAPNNPTVVELPMAHLA